MTTGERKGGKALEAVTARATRNEGFGINPIR